MKTFSLLTKSGIQISFTCSEKDADWLCALFALNPAPFKYLKDIGYDIK